MGGLGERLRIIQRRLQTCCIKTMRLHCMIVFGLQKNLNSWCSDWRGLSAGNRDLCGIAFIASTPLAIIILSLAISLPLWQSLSSLLSPFLAYHRTKKQIVPAFLEGGKAVRQWEVSGRSSCSVQPTAFSRESVHFVLFFAFCSFCVFCAFCSGEMHFGRWCSIGGSLEDWLRYLFY